ncbi:hypothetical protein OIV83_005362 [Microbotryomycetes sp. JL201]|nr:hypothetical protein OIV83_005362 [Microbotryomycetes sp. JL201]
MVIGSTEIRAGPTVELTPPGLDKLQITDEADGKQTVEKDAKPGTACDGSSSQKIRPTARPPVGSPPPTSPKRLAQLQRVIPTHSLTPPTPVEGPSSPIPDSSSAKSPMLAAEPAGRNRPSSKRRQSSGGSGRKYKETLNAYAVEAEDGTRTVNQYRLSGSGALGKGSYATVERATDQETGIEYASWPPRTNLAIKEFSKRRLRQIAATEAARRDRLAMRGRGRGRGRPTRMAQNSRATNLLAGDDSDVLGPDNLDLIRTEVAIMKKVSHPNIASVHEVIDVTSDDALLIVMELCAGGPILKIAEGEQVAPLPNEQARAVFRQMLLGIAYLHHNQIVHRDIKPDNCLYMEDKTTVKLIDFGISKFNNSGQVVESRGSPAYMAPELVPTSSTTDTGLERQEMHGYACDIWSLGVTLFAIALGRLPFDSPDPPELFRSIREDTPVVTTAVSEELQALIKRLLTKSPSDRPTARDLWEDDWITSDGKNPLPPYEENCVTFAEPTQAELDKALNALRASTFLAMSVVAKLKGMRRRSCSGDSGSGAASEGRKSLDASDLVESPMSSPLLSSSEVSTEPPPLHIDESSQLK